MLSAVADTPPDTQRSVSVPGLKVHVPELDGVRGIAVLFVVLYHLETLAGVGNSRKLYGYSASMGWSGVDLFFVLSGFLITGILLDSRPGPNYFRNFYGRRMLRIFPLITWQSPASSLARLCLRGISPAAISSVNG